MEDNSNNNMDPTINQNGEVLNSNRSKRRKKDKKLKPSSSSVSVEISVENDDRYFKFFKAHVEINREIVEKILGGKPIEVQREIVMEFLDGYLSWLSKKKRKGFKKLFFSKTTTTSEISEEGPNVSEEVAQLNVRLFLLLWRTLFSVCEQIAHCSNRIAQLYDWEINNEGNLYKLCENIDRTDIAFNDHDLRFYQDGLKAVEQKIVNFDDINESSLARLKNKTVSEIGPRKSGCCGGKKNRWYRKTFDEPEGLWSFIIALRNYWPIVFFSAYLTIGAWAWFKPEDIKAPSLALMDGVFGVLTLVLELLSRAGVYSCRQCCSCSLPFGILFLTALSYILALGEIGAWFLTTNLKVFDESLGNLICLAAVGGTIVIRLIVNLILFVSFPVVAKPHHEMKPWICGQKAKLLWKLLFFFGIATGVLVPLFYWFVVPTLSRIPFWSFCNSPTIVIKLQCYIGILGLWFPLLATILIMDFISYAFILGFYGSYIATTKRVGYTNDEAYSVVSGFKSFSTLLQKWKYTESKPVVQEEEEEVIDDKKSKKSKKPKKTMIKSAFTTMLDVEKAEGELSIMYDVWYLIVDDLLDMDLISKDVAHRLYAAINWQDIPLGYKAKEIVQFFFSSLSGLKSKELEELAGQADFLESLPSLTQLIPSYGEAVIFDKSYLINMDKKTISNIEFLTHKYKKEWKNFHERMGRMFFNKQMFPPTPDDLLESFLSEQLDNEICDEIRLWASLRGQTLYRTVRGTLSYKMALRAIYQATGRECSLITLNNQVILAHQQYGDPSVLKVIGNDIKLMFKKLSSPRILGDELYGDTPFDLVFDWNPKELESQKSFLMKLAQFDNQDTIQRYTLKNIHNELQIICEYGEELKKMIDGKSVDCPIVPSGPFPCASIIAGLPTATRSFGRTWLFYNKQSSSDEFSKNESYEVYDDDTQSETTQSSSKKKDFKWEFLSYGPAVVHAEEHNPELGWLRVFDSDTGREHEFLIKYHMFEVKPLSVYDIPITTNEYGLEKTILKQYAAFKFAVKNGTSHTSYALVGCLQDVELKQESKTIGGTIPVHSMTNMEYHHSMVAEIETRKKKETDTLREMLSFPQRFPSTGAKNSMNKCLIGIKDINSVLNTFNIDGCLSKLEDAPVDANGIFLGIEIKRVLPRRNPLLLRIQGDLPFADADRIQGKASNQMNGLKFAYGLVTQTKDANQGGNVAEALKFPIVIQRFLSKNNVVAPAIIGFRETIFTRTHGSVARFQAYAEWAFVTIVQRVLSKLGIRMHYGHPDFFQSSWIYSRSALSKVNAVYNLSEDIFAGYVALLHNRRSVHTDEIQDEKGRDTSLASTYTFTAKLAQGAASQMKTRDIFDMNTRLDFVRQFLLFHSSLGYYVATSAMMISVKMYLFGLLVFTLGGYSAENLGNMELIFSLPFLLQIGNFTLIPLLLEAYVEEGFWAVLRVIIDIPLSLVFFMFQAQTTCHHLTESFTKGKSHYEATGRLLGISRKTLVDIYQLYGRSHFETALEYLYYVIAYHIIAASREGGYVPLIAPILCIFVFVLAPFIFQLPPPIKELFQDAGAFGRWIFSSDPYQVLLKEWKNGPLREHVIKNLTWKATFKPSHSRLQTYSIFNNLKNAMNTHWRVDVVAVLMALLRIIVWGFIIVSIPGGMKDVVLKVVVAMLLYILFTISMSSNSGGKKKGCWNTITNFFFVVCVAYFIALAVLLQAWRYFGSIFVGLFLSLKLLKSVSWGIFHMYSLIKKSSAAREWRGYEAKHSKGKLDTPEKDRKIKFVKATLERKLLAGLYIVDRFDRPFFIASLTAIIFLPYIIFNLIWAIPGLAKFILYGHRLKRKRKRNQNSGGSPWSGYNTSSVSPDMDDLPSFEFEDDGELFF